ncbi:MAG: hypothetical protein NTW29_04230 [Bacteroidetes bacterium]|nr:hypothetical protein [Bacteroidota bacterium]
MRKIIFHVVVLSLVLFSCETAEFIQHTPTLTNTGEHTGKNQLHGKILYSTGNSTSNSGDNSNGKSPYESVNGIQAQGSYSFASKFAFHSSYMHSSEKGGSEEFGQKNVVYRYNRNITEAGFAFFDNLSSDNTFFVELAAGTGFGKFNATEVSSPLVPGGRYYDHNVFKLYLQPTIYYASPLVGMSTGLKFSSIRFNNINTNYTTGERENRSITTGSELKATTMDFFLKTDLYLRKLPWMGFNLQFLYSTDLKKTFNYNQTDWNAGLGLSFRLDNLKTKK